MSRRPASRADHASREVSAPVKRHSSLGWPGFVFVGLTVFLAVGAVNSQNNLLFWVFGVAVAGVIVSGVISGSGLMGVRLTAHPLSNLECGATGSLSYTVISRNRRLPVFALEIHEVASEPDAAGAFAESAAGLVYLSPRTRERTALRFTPTRRGVLVLDRVRAESRFPFGLLVKSLEFSCPRKALVLPARLDLRVNALSIGSTGGAGVGSRLARTGSGTEFYSIREYTPGDPRRSIAWRPSARRGDLLVIERNEPKSRSVWVWVTAPPEDTQNGDTLAERALAVALGLVREGVRRQRAVGLWMPWAGVRIEPAIGRAHERRTAETLATLDLAISNAGPSAWSPPPGGDASDVLLVPLGTPPPEARAHPERLTFDPAHPEQWLVPGADLPEALREQTDRGRG